MTSLSPDLLRQLRSHAASSPAASKTAAATETDTKTKTAPAAAAAATKTPPAPPPSSHTASERTSPPASTDAAAADGPTTRTLYHADGTTVAQVIPYADGHIDGVLRSYDTAGQPVAEMSFHQGVPDGPATFYHDGKRHMTATYQAGQKHGLCHLYTPQGALSSTHTYAHDQLDGLSTSYNTATGKPLLTETYKAGKKHGPAHTFYPNGHPLADETYADDHLVGTSTHYYASGKVMQRCRYDAHGTCIHKTLYDPKGTEIHDPNAPQHLSSESHKAADPASKGAQTASKASQDPSAPPPQDTQT